MGLQLKRTPVTATRFLLVSAVVTLGLAMPLIGVAAGRIASADSTPDTSKIKFIGGERYVPEGNSTKLAAQLSTYKATTDVKFYIDGKTDAPVDGVDNGGANFHKWRLYTALAAGKHTVTAQVRINGDWYEATGSATVYSIDMPTVSYNLPTSERHTFRPGDNPVRITADDEFDQFRDVSFSLFYYDTDKDKIGKHIATFKELRADCNQSEAGRRVRCDLNAANGWTSLSEGVYAVKLTTNSRAGNGVRAAMQDYWMQFTVDNTRPVVGDLRIEGQATVKDSLTVSAIAEDANLESIDFYVTEPRESDGACTGNGTKLAEYRAAAPDSADGRYRAVLDVSAVDAAGQQSVPYCVTAIARDKAMNNSTLSSASFAVDHMAPLVTLEVTSSSSPSASTPVTLRGTVNGKATLALFRDGTQIPDFNLSMDGAGQWSFALAGGLEKGDHVLKIVATDPYGNSSTEVSSPQSYATLTVGAYVPPKEQSTISTHVTPSKLPQAPIAPAPSVAQIIASQHHQSQTSPKANDEAILGAETSKQADSGAVIAPSARGWTFFGIAWYWWLVALAGAAAVMWRLVARMRQENDALPA